MEKKNPLPLITSCLAVGGVIMAAVFCIGIGFGLNTVVGKEALYTAFVLQGVNLWSLRHTGALKPVRIFLRVWIWGGVFLLAALILGILRLELVSPWVRWPCLAGTVLALTGWLGVLISNHRAAQD